VFFRVLVTNPQAALNAKNTADALLAQLAKDKADRDAKSAADALLA
jgi:hypothetical protein